MVGIVTAYTREHAQHFVNIFKKRMVCASGKNSLK